MACWLEHPRDVCDQPDTASSAIVYVPGVTRYCTVPVFPDVVIVVDALPDPPIVNSNDPFPFTVFLMIVRRALLVVVALHSVE